MGTRPRLDPDEVHARARSWAVDLCRTRLQPPPRLTVSEWADRFRVLSREASSEPGRWHTDRAPYQRGIMDACSDPTVEQVVMMSSAQVGKTEMIGNLVCFFMDQDPAPILVMQPTLDMAAAWSKDRLAPMLRDTPRLRGKVKDPRSRDSGNTTFHKKFPGGHLTVTGANSAASLASRPIRVVLADEVDRYPDSAGSEGDPVSLAVKRTATFWNRKVLLTSTPTVKGASRIEEAWGESDQRRFHVPCPECGEAAPLSWPNLTWDRTEKDETTTIHHPETAVYGCPSCGALIDEARKGEMLAGGEWVAENPDSPVAGFHLNALYSPWKRWAELVQEWLDAKGNPERLRVFVNTTLGESWEDRQGRVEPEGLAARAESYPAEIPDGVGVLTAGVDVQADRLEVQVVGWGADEEAWLIGHWRLHGDLESDDLWQRLRHVLQRTYEHESGAKLSVLGTMVDSGFETRRVYNFVRGSEGSIWAAKGIDTRARDPISRTKKPNRDRVRPWAIGTYAFKDTLFARLRIERPGPGYIHFCAPTDTGADAEYFAQFGAERVELSRQSMRRVRRYVQVRDRNEAIDLWVLSLAALHALGVRNQLAEWAEKARSGGSDEEESPQPRQRARRRSGWVGGWK